MATEENEISKGWPLGLEIMHTRLRVIERSQAAPAAEPPYPLHAPSPSFSSFTTSNLDTESTASFFQDHSVSLGRLIGIRPGERGMHFTRYIHWNERETISVRGVTVSSEVSGGRGVDASQGNCIPLLLGTIEKMSRSKSKSRQ